MLQNRSEAEAVLAKMVTADLLEKVTFVWRLELSEGTLCEGLVSKPLSRREGKAMSPEEKIGLMCSGNSKGTVLLERGQRR